jgi:NADH-quinone oxidoreductase subunit J
MTFDLILFIGLALVAVASALGMLFSRSSVYSALNLIINFSAVAVLYLLLGAPFIALSQVAVYTGAIMVLFVFVIMMLGAERVGATTVLSWQRPLAFVLGAILLVEMVSLIFFRSNSVFHITEVAPDFGSPASIGAVLFNQYLLPFEVTSILLLTAMVSAVVLTRRKE